jgi:hypothetical protein
VLKPDLEAELQSDLGLSRGLSRRLKAIGQDNVRVICDYIKCLENEIQLSENYKKLNVTVLVYLSGYHGNKKFKEMAKGDNLSASQCNRVGKGRTSFYVATWDSKSFIFV